MATLLLTRSDVAALIDPPALVAALEDGFRAYSCDGATRALRLRADAPGPGSATVLFPGTSPGIPAYTVKVHAKFPAEQPAIRGVVCLHDAATGALLAVMDSTHLTAVRTGLAGALAAHRLARGDAGDVAVVGAGVQGEQQLRCFARLRRLQRVRVHDVAEGRAASFAARLGAELSLAIATCAAVADAVRAADVVFVATWSREPLLFPGMLGAGAHVTTLGADEPGKCEVSAELLRGARFFCDDRDLAVRMGALGGAGLGPEAAATELGEVLAGARPGRTTPEEITVFGGVGLAFQDLVAAWQVYRAALARGAGVEIDFLG